MKCPFCGEDANRVIDSRPADENTAIRRRRVCEACGRRFTTFEKRETYPLMVVKKDRRREPYARDKMKAGLLQACHKRPVSAEEISRVLDDIENEVYNRFDKEVDSSVLGEMVMERLRRLDEVAYVRFASVYRSFTDVNTFAEEVKRLLTEEKHR